MDTTGDRTRLEIPVSQRGDTGTYKITARNPYGEDSADIKVIVVGGLNFFLNMNTLFNELHNDFTDYLFAPFLDM